MNVDRSWIDLLLAEGSQATGLASKVEGFAWQPDFDALFALGWPHLRLLVDGHRDDRNPAKAVARVIDKSIEGHYFVEWPREVARRYVRAFGGRQAGALTTRNAFVAAAVDAPSAPVSQTEARQMLASRVRAGGPTGKWFVDHFVLLLEAMVGTNVVLDGLVDAIEGEVGTDYEVHQLAYGLGFLLLRVGPDVAARQRSRLQAVLERTASSDYLYDGLACSLGGAEAARSMGLNPGFYHHASDDPSAVVEAVQAGNWLPSARHAFLGGDAALEAAAPYWKRQKGTELQRKLALSLAPIQSPFAVRILADMSAKSKVKKHIAGICAPFAEGMLPVLRSLTTDEAIGPAATSLAAALSVGPGAT